MLLRCGLLFDGTSSDVRSGATIRIKGDRIASVARDDGAARPGEAVVDLRRYTVLPGLVDAHDHLGFNVGEPRDRLAAESADELFTKMTATAQRALEAGITTVRDLGERRRVDLRVRAAIEAGRPPGPRLLVSGEPLTFPGGPMEWVEGAVVQGAEAIRARVRDLAGAGVDWVKVFATWGAAPRGPASHAVPFTAAEVAAAVAEARARGKWVAVHAHEPEAARAAVEAGAHTIEHGVHLDAATLDLLAERRVPLVVTAGYYRAAAEHPGGDAAVRERCRRIVDVYRGTLANARRAGVLVAVGTDENHGRIDTELAALVEAGYTPAEALRAATADGAEACGVADRAGRIAPGYAADVIAVEGNPLESVEAVGAVAFVMQSGQVYLDRTRPPA